MLLAREGGVVILPLNRGERFNPLSTAMIAGLQAELDRVPRTRPRGWWSWPGRAGVFCAGHDLNEMVAHTDDQAWQQRLFDACSRMMLALTRMPQPVIARVHGFATAAGC